MFETMFQDNKELQQGWIFRVQGAAQTQRRLDQHLDAELHHAKQVRSLY